MNQSNLLKNVEFNNESRLRAIEGKDKKEILMAVHMLFMKVEKQFLMLFKVEYLETKKDKVDNLKY